jgi:porphobilinogen synthase
MLQRPRRNRQSPAIRGMVEETNLSPAHLMCPLFLEDGKDTCRPIPSMPGVHRWSPDRVLYEVEACVGLGLNNFILFPAVADNLKSPRADYALREDNFYLLAATQIKKRFPQVCLVSDVALDPYSSDGHDGLLLDGEIVNDETLPILADMAVAQARAGFDMIGPSDMMDGRVGHIRRALDSQGHYQTGILAYTAKYASAFYGPFRDALDSAPKSGDKKTYQMDPANKREALREARLDEAEGADMLMVKPALHYLDVIHLIRENRELPVAAYHVSGEYAMLKAACLNGWLDYQKAMPETLLSIRRAGADVILTYCARDFATWYRG